MLKYGKPSPLPAHVSHIPTSSTITTDTVYFTDPIKSPVVDSDRAFFIPKIPGIPGIQQSKRHNEVRAFPPRRKAKAKAHFAL
jgi:hypothetical protein